MKLTISYFASSLFINLLSRVQDKSVLPVREIDGIQTRFCDLSLNYKEDNLFYQG